MIIAVFKKRWSTMSTKEKVMVGVELVCDIGSDLLMGYLCSKVIPYNAGRVSKTLAMIAAGGAGMALGRVSANEFENLYNSIAGDKEAV